MADCHTSNQVMPVSSMTPLHVCTCLLNVSDWNIIQIYSCLHSRKLSEHRLNSRPKLKIIAMLMQNLLQKSFHACWVLRRARLTSTQVSISEYWFMMGRMVSMLLWSTRSDLFPTRIRGTLQKVTSHHIFTFRTALLIYCPEKRTCKNIHLFLCFHPAEEGFPPLLKT